MKAFAKDFEHLTKNARNAFFPLANGGTVVLYLQKKKTIRIWMFGKNFV